MTVRSREESVRRGEKVTLRCEAEGDAPLDLGWRTRGSTVGTTYDDRFVSNLHHFPFTYTFPFTYKFQSPRNSLSDENLFNQM